MKFDSQCDGGKDGALSAGGRGRFLQLLLPRSGLPSPVVSSGDAGGVATLLNVAVLGDAAAKGRPEMPALRFEEKCCLF